MVVDPRHRGHGLGLLVCQAGLEYVGRLGYDHAYLLTDDFRLPADQDVPTPRLRAGATDASHPERWAAIHRQLGNA